MLEGKEERNTGFISNVTMMTVILQSLAARKIEKERELFIKPFPPKT
jgi:hypothetical protein